MRPASRHGAAGGLLEAMFGHAAVGRAPPGASRRVVAAVAGRGPPNEGARDWSRLLVAPPGVPDWEEGRTPMLQPIETQILTSYPQ